MNIHFSRHAKRQMKWRRISEDEIILTVTFPDRIEKTVKGRKNAFKEVGKKLLKVTFVEEDGKITIITAVDKRD